MAHLQIRLLGGLRITRDGGAVPPPPRHLTALLGYLLVFGDRMHARSLLAGLFWGDKPDATARLNLNDAIYRLRQHLDAPGTPKTRSLLNLAMLGALNRRHELKTHVAGALRNGVSKAEIREVFLQVGIYAGIPAAVDAFRIAREVFAEKSGG